MWIGMVNCHSIFLYSSVITSLQYLVAQQKNQRFILFIVAKLFFNSEKLWSIFRSPFCPWRSTSDCPLSLKNRSEFSHFRPLKKLMYDQLLRNFRSDSWEKAFKWGSKAPWLWVGRQSTHKKPGREHRENKPFEIENTRQTVADLNAFSVPDQGW
jgi:hypothetical protein